MMGGELTILGVVAGTDGSPLRDVPGAADDISVRTVASVAEAISTLTGADEAADRTSAAVDCLVLDVECSTGDVTAAIERLRDERSDLPILLAGATGTTAADALDAGATDIVDYDREAWPTILAHRVRNVVEQYRSMDATQDRSPSQSDESELSRHSNPPLDSLLEWSCDRLSVLDREGTYTFVSPAVEHLMGYEPAELLGTSGFEYVHPDDRDEVREVFERIVNHPDEIHRVEYRLRDADGNWRWVESRGTNRFDDPDIEGIVINSREITERKERERQLRTERRRFEVLFERLTQPIVEFEFQDGVPIVKQVNPAFERTFGYGTGELLGEPIDEYVVPDTRREGAKTLNERVKSGEQSVSEELTRQTTDGQRHFLFQTAVYNEGAEGFAVYADITEQKERQQQLREEKALSDTILNTLPDVFFLFDEHGNFIRWNDHANEVSGYTDEEIASMHPSEFVVEDDREKVFGAMAEVIEHDDTVQFEARARRKDGDPIPYEYTGTTLTDETGTMLGIVGLGRDISRQKERERELERKNHLFQKTQEMADIGAWEFDVETSEVWLTDQLKRIYGVSPDQRVGVDEAIAYFVPDDRPKIRNALDRAVEAGESYELELQLVDEQGNERWVNAQGEPQFEDDEVVRVRGTMQDITQQKGREEKLREEEALTQTIFDALPDVFYAFDKQINFLRWNDRLSEVTGYSDEEIASMHPAQFVAPEDREQIFDGIAEVVEDGETVTIDARFETKAGDHIPYEFTGTQMTDETGEMLGLVGIGRDISERKKRQRRFEAVFNNTYQFTGLMEPDGTVLEVNDTALRFGGLDREDVVGELLWEAYWFQNEDHAREVAREAVEQARAGSLYREEVEVQGADRTEIIDFSVRPIIDEQGEVTLLIPEGRTITDLKERERHLKVLNRFLRHNLRNKMTVIKGTADVLRDEFADSEYLEHLEQIDETAVELIELGETAHELLQTTIETDTELGPKDPTDILSRVVSDFRRAHPDASISLSVETERSVTADHRLGAVFEQLIENAIVHADHDSPSVTVTATETDGTVSVRVRDNGPGIPSDELSGIVTDEEQTQLTHGTGFGLWLVRSIVDDYNGDLDYEDVPDGGSDVIVRLQPVTDEPSAATYSEEAQRE